MAIRHFRGLTAKGQPKQLVAEADSKSGDTVRRESPQGLLSVRDRGGISGTIGQENSVRIMAKRGFRRGVSRHDRDPAVVLREQSQDVSLDPVIVGENVMTRARISPRVGLPCRDAGRQVEPLYRWTRFERGATLFIGLIPCTDHSSHDPHRPDVSGEAAGINFFQNRDLSTREPGSQSTGRAPVGVCSGELSDDYSRYLGCRRLRVLGVDPVVSDLGRGHDDDLTTVGWVGEHLLIAGQVGGEDHFRHRGYRARGGCRAQAATKKGSVLEEEEPWFGRPGVGGQLRVLEWPGMSFAEPASELAWSAAVRVAQRERTLAAVPY